MSDLASIPGIGKSSLELLEAAGFIDTRALARARADQLAAELQRANSILGIAKKAPSPAIVENWIRVAREMTGEDAQEEPETSKTVMPVDYESTPEGAALVAAAPVAIPLPARILMAHQVPVADIPPAILLNRYAGELDVRTKRRLPENRAPKPMVANGNFVRIAESTGQKLDIDTSRLRSTTEPQEPIPIRPRTHPTDERVALIRTPRSSTNKGRDPRSRWYIRGVLHSHPRSIYAGAIVTLLVMILTPLAVASAILLLLSGEVPKHFSWVPGWLIVFPLVLPLFGICYLIWGVGGGCRICGQKLFRHRPHFKNSRAHRVPGLGYIFPLCIHILLFRWFRCTHCGTPVRLKE